MRSSFFFYGHIFFTYPGQTLFFQEGNDMGFKTSPPVPHECLRTDETSIARAAEILDRLLPALTWEALDEIEGVLADYPVDPRTARPEAAWRVIWGKPIYAQARVHVADAWIAQIEQAMPQIWSAMVAQPERFVIARIGPGKADADFRIEGRYTNGGAICRHCGAFKTVFKPIVRLGAWRDPISVFELQSALLGPVHRDAADSREKKTDHRQMLRLRRAGIRLPSFSACRDEAQYRDACRIAILSWYRQHMRSPATDALADVTQKSPLTDLFDGFMKRMLDAELREAEEEGLFTADQAGPEQA